MFLLIQTAPNVHAAHTNLRGWPRFKALPTNQKLILYILWGAPELNAAGAGLISPSELAGALDFEVEEVTSALKNIHDSKLIIWDENENEVFINDWYRCHIFDSGLQKRMLKNAIEKTNKNLMSAAIKKAVAEKSAPFLA